MTPEQRAAYIIAQTGCALIEALGMLIEERFVANKGGTVTIVAPMFHSGEFKALIEKYGISHNAVIGLFNQ